MGRDLKPGWKGRHWEVGKHSWVRNVAKDVVAVAVALIAVALGIGGVATSETIAVETIIDTTATTTTTAEVFR